MDLSARTVRKNGIEVKLTPTEYALLRLLVVHAGKVLTHRQLLMEVWGPNAVEQTHYLRVHIAHLREKLEDNAAQPKFIITEPAVGYRTLGAGDPS
jgi:two-component system KDP operon response regulator KdpE